MCDYVGMRRVGAVFFCYADSRDVGGLVQDPIYANPRVTFISSFIYFIADGGKEIDGAAICHHHNNVKTAAARCAIGMMMCEDCACVYLGAG